MVPTSAKSMPPSSSKLRFRPQAMREKTAVTTPTQRPHTPRTPRSPMGAYSGEPVPRRGLRLRQWHRLKRLGLTFLLGVFILAALLIFSSAIPPLHRSGGPIAAMDSISARLQRYRPSPLFSAWRRKRTFVPDFSTSVHLFRDDDVFQDTGMTGDRAWLSMFPEGNGSVVVKNPRDYGLPLSADAIDASGKTVPDTEVYEVSIVRQLGCLSLLRELVIDHDNMMSQRAHVQEHALHCLDHVRQALLCAADTTLEPTGDDSDMYLHEMNDAEFGFATARHMCRNYTEVLHWIEANRLRV